MNEQRDKFMQWNINLTLKKNKVWGHAAIKIILKHYAKWKNPGTTGYILCCSTYMERSHSVLFKYLHCWHIRNFLSSMRNSSPLFNSAKLIFKHKECLMQLGFWTGLKINEYKCKHGRYCISIKLVLLENKCWFR